MSKFYSLTLKNNKILQLPSVNTCLPPPAYMRFSPSTTWVGTRGHAIVERIIKGEVISTKEWEHTHPEVKQAARAFVRFTQMSKFIPVQAEVMVYSLEFGYAGTLDVLGKYRRRDSIGDFKTGDADIEATAMKLAAYDHAYFEMNPGIKPGATWHIKIDRKTGVPTWIQYQRKEVEKYFEMFCREKRKVIDWVGRYDPKEILKEELCQNQKRLSSIKVR